MKTLLLCAACALTLGACNNSPEINEKNASVSEVAAKVRAASGDAGFVKPGEWSSHVTIEEMSMPGMPPELSRRMQATMAEHSVQDFKSCLTPEDVKQPKGKFFTGNDQCRYDHFKMGDGVIDAAMRCGGGPSGAEQVMAMSGTYGPEHYQMRMTMSPGGNGSAGGKGMTMKMRVESKRIGDCSADIASKAG